MRIMEGQGVDGHVGDTPRRNEFARVCENVSFFSLLFSLCRVLSCLVLSCLVLSCLVLSCLVLSCLVVCVCWCVCVGVQDTHRSFPQESWSTTALSGTANDRRNRERVVLDLFSNFKCVRYKGYFR